MNWDFIFKAMAHAFVPAKNCLQSKDAIENLT